MPRQKKEGIRAINEKILDMSIDIIDVHIEI